MWTYFQAGGPLMWALLACSIVAVAIILERSWFWSTLGLKKDEAYAQQLLDKIKAGDMTPPSRRSGIISTMLYAGMSVDEAASGKAMEVVALEWVDRMRRGMNLLDTVITAAPMLGIMGTVLGIISSFDMLGSAGVSDPKAVIAGIAQALITTATGLGIAVVTIFPFNYFNFRIEQAQDALEVFSSRLDLARSGAIKD